MTVAVVKELVLEALRAAGTRGLTRDELRRRFGGSYGLQLRALERDQHRLRFHASRYRRGEWWRVELIAEADPDAKPAAAEPAALALPIDAPAPACAIFDDPEDR